MRIRVVCAVLLGLVCAEIAAAENPTWPWLRLETKEFVILSDARPKDLEAFAVDYAAFRWLIQEQVLGAEVRQPRSVIVLFRREKDFLEHAPVTRDKDSRLITFTTVIEGTALTTLSVAGDRRAAMTSLIEFETMWMLGRTGYSVPTWMAQGTGEVLSTMRLKKGRCIFGDGDLRFTEPLNRHQPYPWPKFFAISNESKEYRGSERLGVFHGQAWALMRWILLSRDGGQLRFARLATLLRSSYAIPAVEEVMGVPEAKFRSAALASLSAAPISLPYDENAVRARWRLEPAPEAEVRAQLADVLTAAGKSAAAETELARAQALAPDAVGVLEARARHEAAKGNHNEATSLYRLALAAGSKNPQAYLRSAHARIDASANDGVVDYPGGGGANIAVALEEIRQARALAPDTPEVFEAMGRAFFVAPKIDESAIAELNQGLRPGRTRVLHYRALLAERLNKIDESIADLRAVMADPGCPPELRLASGKRIAALVARRDADRATALVEAHKFAEARSLIAAAQQANPDGRDNYERSLKWVDRQEQAVVFAEIRTRVGELVADKKFSEAKEAVEAAEKSSTNTGLDRDLAKLRAWLEENADLHQLRLLYRSRRWSEFHDRVQTFLQRYPQSPEVGTLRRFDEEAQWQLTQPPAKSERL